jgi:hypothetical protein
MTCAFQIQDILGETVECQFGVHERDLIEFDGRLWCHFHLPLRTGEAVSEKTQWDAKRIDAFNQAVFERIDNAKAASEAVDLSGIVFPAGPNFRDYTKESLPEISFRRAKFGDGCSFENVTFAGYARFETATFAGSSWFARAYFETVADFEQIVIAGTAWFNEVNFGSNARFIGAKFADQAYFHDATFRALAQFHDAIFEKDVTFAGAAFGHAVYFRPTEFRGDADFRGSSPSEGKAACRDAFPKLATFHRSRFHGRAVFTNRRFLDSTHFGDVVFEVAPEFHNAILHQDTDFAGTQFFDRKGTRGVDAARAYRTLKLAMESVRSRDEEARFYAYEQQSLRDQKNTPLSARVFSWFYEVTADYGQSFALPLFWLLITLFVFTLNYALIGGAPMWRDGGTLLRFALQQVFQPFWVLRGVTVPSGATEAIPLWLAFLAAMHSLLTLAFLALFLLAVRRRFKLD